MVTAQINEPSSRPRAKPRVLIASDQGPTRAGVRLALESLATCSEASDAASAIDAAVREQPNVCLLDVDIPGDGLNAAAEISARVPQSAIVMLTHKVSEH